MGAIQQLLQEHELDIDERTLARVFEACLSRAGGPPYPDPAEHLSPQELETLARGGFRVDPPEHGVEDPAIQAAVSYTSLLLTALTTEQAAARLGVTDGRIRQRLKKRELYGIKLGKDWRLPRFQFADDGLVFNIARVLPAVPRDLSPVALHHWLTHPDPDLVLDGAPLSPLRWLQCGGDPQLVAELAQDLR